MPPTKSTRESIERAVANIERGLEALDSRGEEGLQDFLDQLYPGTERTPAPQDDPHVDVAEGLTGDQPEMALRDGKAPETSAQDGPWQGEVPGSRRQLGHGLYAFDLDGPVPMHIVAGPPAPTVKYQPGMEVELSSPPETNAEARTVQEPATPNSPTSATRTSEPHNPR